MIHQTGTIHFLEPAEGANDFADCLFIERCAVFELDVYVKSACKLTLIKCKGDTVPGSMEGWWGGCHDGHSENFCGTMFAV